MAEPLDAGTEHFEATSLQITIDVGNPATNVILARHGPIQCAF